jgi:predicted  nucleic acid-binding Zn-ribbon protein
MTMMRRVINDLRSELNEANGTIKEQRKMIESLTASLTKQIDSLPAAVAGDPKLVETLRTQLQSEFDKRYAKAMSIRP